ncbi:hypothetical protein LCY76_20760 [Fictibacillus sp. KIGAM418]|uniref:DUF1433 domain-containing protein n=1 Tax=Fictibacillus marinisediminis TaxID=2878389 RepID=A0A9X1XDT5_9BACL|nr:hypothetical protein [Fictibacillus marinisediminis]MCK6259007.1 hypothetical protein [Fictibacillus marinisediminis]
MKKIIHILIIGIVLFIGGCGGNGMDKDEIREQSKSVAVEYMKIEEEKDFVATGVEFPSGDVGVVFVHGYCKDNKDKKMFVTVNYEDDYKVEGIAEGVKEKSKE